MADEDGRRFVPVEVTSGKWDVFDRKRGERLDVGPFVTRADAQRAADYYEANPDKVDVQWRT
ncbi:MAG: hypothetical protein OXQ31_23125 [Spirochaetaceae bacterium]|nr:hypothetical protein [Spirochaetaceae bacterium]